MKTNILSALMMLCAFGGFAQDIPSNSVPSVVMNVFKQKFPKATDVEWERKGELYKVEFEIGRKEHAVWINGAGNVEKHKLDISNSDLPAAVKTAIASEYKGYRINDAERLDAGGKVTYKVEVKKGAEDMDTFFDEQGREADKY
ncbi:MAG TPA: PepSY-like domain-containing protein [Dyadobacter sp.]|jgi:hypothetical protein|nr:PepSY-like domain-containing protein [Dyadobacter sp.]